MDIFAMPLLRFFVFADGFRLMLLLSPLRVFAIISPLILHRRRHSPPLIYCRSADDIIISRYCRRHYATPFIIIIFAA
jgi:hypothetical protein